MSSSTEETAVDALIIHWDGEQRAFDGSAPVVLGRDPDADVTLDNPHVSRRHVELRPGPTGWVAHDLGSTQGTFVGQDRIDQHTVGEGAVLVLGRPDVGAQVRLEVLESSTEPSVPGPTTAPATAAPPESTIAPPAAPPPDTAVRTRSRPGGELREDELGGATVVTGATTSCSPTASTSSAATPTPTSCRPIPPCHVATPR